MRQAIKDDVLALAEQVSQRQSNAKAGCDTHATSEKDCAKPHAKGSGKLYAIPESELRAEAGEIDWEANKNEPYWVETFSRTVAEGRLLRQGIVPETYTAKTTCKNCGDVPVPPGFGANVNNCRWCFVGGYK